MRSLGRFVVTSLLSLLVSGAGWAQSPARSTAPAARVEGFHAVLLLGRSAPGALPTDLPAGVAKALKEASELLPFKSYQLQDQALVRTAGDADTSVHLAGPLSRDYTLALVTLSDSQKLEPGKVRVHVSLGYKSPDTRSGSETVLLTEFSARPGETVVVGTSRVKGDESIVLLITPLPAKGVAGNAPSREIERLGIGLVRQRRMTVSNERIVMTGDVELDIGAATVSCDEAMMAKGTGSIALLGRVRLRLTPLPHIEAIETRTEGALTYYRGNVTVRVGTSGAAVIADEAVARPADNAVEFFGKVRLAPESKRRPE